MKTRAGILDRIEDRQPLCVVGAVFFAQVSSNYLFVINRLVVNHAVHCAGPPSRVKG